MKSLIQRLISLLIASSFWGSCHFHTNDCSVQIHHDTDTITLGCSYSAELYLKHNNKLLPADFYILFMQDTFLLDYDHPKKCAYFNVEPSSEGEKNYKGFATYGYQGTKTRQQDFTINFFVCR